MRLIPTIGDEAECGLQFQRKLRPLRQRTINCCSGCRPWWI